MINQNVPIAEIPLKGQGGRLWNHLHSEREDICEAMLKQPPGKLVSEMETRPRTGSDSDVLQERLRKIDDALDRVMSGSYGKCSRCGHPIGESRLKSDPATAECLECETVATTDCMDAHLDVGCLSQSELDQSEGLILEAKMPYETICVQTVNTTYRFLLLDPKTGRSLVEGGKYFSEPTEATILGSSTRCSAFRSGWIGVGFRLELWANDQLVSTSAVQSVRVDQPLTSGLTQANLERLRRH